LYEKFLKAVEGSK